MDSDPAVGSPAVVRTWKTWIDSSKPCTSTETFVAGLFPREGGLGRPGAVRTSNLDVISMTSHMAVFYAG